MAGDAEEREEGAREITNLFHGGVKSFGGRKAPAGHSWSWSVRSPDCQLPWQRSRQREDNRSGKQNQQQGSWREGVGRQNRKCTGNRKDFK